LCDEATRQSDLDFEAFGAGERRHFAPDDPPRHDCFRQAVAAEAIEAVHVPTCSLADREQSAHPVGFAVFVHTDATHRVVLSRADGNQIRCWIDPREVATDVRHFEQLCVEVPATEVAQV
jgi:hypothetical protein